MGLDRQRASQRWVRLHGYSVWIPTSHFILLAVGFRNLYTVPGLNAILYLK